MDLRETVLVALRSLRGNRLRSLLTALGIIIGVAAVIILVALGSGVQAGFDAQFSRLANQITISKATGAVPGGGTARDLTDQDVAALGNKTQTPDIDSVTPSTTGSAVLVAGQAQERASLIGTTHDYLQVSNRTIQAGEWLTPDQARGNAKVAVLGQEAVRLLWGHAANLPEVIGKEIRIGHATFRVAGVLSPDKQDDNVAIVPMGAARAYLIGTANAVNQIIIKATSAATLPAATEQLTNILDRQHHIHTANNRDFKVKAYQNLIDQRSQLITFLTLFTAAVAAISLIVGGIGVANIMLVAVTERTREIGIRKAIGAPRRAILTQFLIEAIILTGLGGLIGVLVGVGASTAGRMVLPRFVSAFPPPILTPSPIVIAFGVSLLIGIVAGVYPANRAARLRPIEALRFE
ncbi:MAG TPA: ABC transporter permease [Pseudonocardia sp.]|jgi:putative ABC transport system permease protein|uniref:ABC transporter permease n=1 Tax=Pseudonocardia sp. TaxID=60912 RepID=UPI002EDAD2EF